MDRSALFDVARDVMGEVLGVEPDTITEESRLRDDLGADSLDLVEIAFALETRLGVTLTEDGMRGVNTVREAVDRIAAPE